jgi:hypothetical protein
MRKPTKLYTKTAFFDQMTHFFWRIDSLVVPLQIFLVKTFLNFKVQ